MAVIIAEGFEKGQGEAPRRHRRQRNALEQADQMHAGDFILQRLLSPLRLPFDGYIERWYMEFEPVGKTDWRVKIRPPGKGEKRKKQVG